jgi:carboxyl-terminal processing protease
MEKKKYKLKGKVITIVLCIVCLAIGAFGGIVLTHKTSSSEEINASVLSEIMDIIDNKWVDTTGSDEDSDSRMLSGLVSGLSDPYTTYMTIDEASDFNDSINGNLVGIGVQFAAIDDGGLVLEVFHNTPAENAGMKAGDIIVKVDNQSTASKTSTEIKKLVVGEAGSDVKITVSRANKEMELTMTRAAVETDVQYYVSGNYGFLDLNTFGQSTASHVEEALKYFKENNAEYIIIDIRGNGGGYLDAVSDILSLFVPDNQVLLKLQYKNNEIKEIKSSSDNKYSFKQGYILMDGESASCSEVLIGGLTEILGYKTIGTKSFGKGIAQTQQTLSNGSILKYTNSKWLTPNGVSIQGNGFEPDYEVKEESISDYTYSKFDTTYKYDSVSDNVKLMQKMLKKLGYDVDREDGYFSKTTQSALKQYQKSIGVTQDGVYTFSLAKKLYASVAVEVLQNTEDKGLLKALELIK